MNGETPGFPLQGIRQAPYLQGWGVRKFPTTFMLSRFLIFAGMMIVTLLPSRLESKVLRVGPSGEFARPCAAIAAAAAGDTIEVDSSIPYDGDVCAWKTDGLIIRGVGAQRAVLNAAGKSSQGKAIWVIGAENTTIENMEFTGAKVPDQNGAGIRSEGANLTVRNCYFHDNEEGILSGNDRQKSVVVEFSEFARNGYEDGQAHNIYIGHAGKFIFRFNYSHHSIVGHLVKSRAAENYILYNRLSDEATGTGSYEIDLPNGGKSFVIGNVIEQGPRTENNKILSYLEEGRSPANPQNLLFVVNNTFVNHHLTGENMFIYVDPVDRIPAIIRNNIFYGPGVITNQQNAILLSNFFSDPKFVDDLGYDYRVKKGSRVIGAGTEPSTGLDFSLRPEFQYVHPACAEGRKADGEIDIGAYQFEGGTGVAPPNAPTRCATGSSGQAGTGSA